MVKLFVEGGGDNNKLRTKCREGFRSFLEKAGLTGHMPRIVACGSRNAAYKDYCTAVRNREKAVLLVDSEVPVPDELMVDKSNMETWQPWEHLKDRDGWTRPENICDTDCHLMVELMEAWFLADTDALKEYYGQSFRESGLPSRADIESISKEDVLSCLKNATDSLRSGCYHKGRHSFDILKQIDPNKVMNKSPWAKRFVELLAKKN